MTSSWNQLSTVCPDVLYVYLTRVHTHTHTHTHHQYTHVYTHSEMCPHWEELRSCRAKCWVVLRGEINLDLFAFWRREKRKEAEKPSARGNAAEEQ